MSQVVLVLLFIIMLLCMTPPLLWFIMNVKKYRETYTWGFKRFVFWSWFVAYGLAFVIGIIIIFIVYL